MSGGWVLVFGAGCGAAGGLAVAYVRDVQRWWAMRRLVKRWKKEHRKGGMHRVVCHTCWRPCVFDGEMWTCRTCGGRHAVGTMDA